MLTNQFFYSLKLTPIKISNLKFHDVSNDKFVLGSVFVGVEQESFHGRVLHPHAHTHLQTTAFHAHVRPHTTSFGFMSSLSSVATTLTTPIVPVKPAGEKDAATKEAEPEPPKEPEPVQEK